MSIHYPATLHKEERLCSRKLIDAIFSGNHSRSMSTRSLRVVYMPLNSDNEDVATDNEDTATDNGAPCTDNGMESTTACPLPKAKMLISVPKRYFKRAVKRNRVKRQVREAYRKNKSIIADKAVALAFIWTSPHLSDSQQVEHSVVNLLTRVREKMEKTAEEQTDTATPEQAPEA